MKKIIFILILLFPFALFSQGHRFIYSYSYVPDSTRVDSLITEKTRLDIFEDHSEFLSDLIAKRDSVLSNAIQKKQSQSSIKIPDGNFKNKVYSSKEFSYTIEYIGIIPYKVIQKHVFEWKLINNTKEIQGYKCQKAILVYGGRKWEAWFTQDIPFQNGPYIFGGLPGLIIEIKDSKNHHSFKLIENYKFNITKTNIFNRPFFSPITINELQFKKKWKEYVNSPIGATEQFMILNPGILNGKSFDENNNEIDFNQKKREEVQYAQKQLIKNNNYINLYLYH